MRPAKGSQDTAISKAFEVTCEPQNQRDLAQRDRRPSSASTNVQGCAFSHTRALILRHMQINQ